MTGQTRPSSEQLRLVSSKTGEHILDDYLEAAEKGNRTLPDLLSDLFNSSGSYYRGSGLYNWKGSYTNGVPYITGDTFTNAATNSHYVAITNFTASGNHAQEIIDNKIALVFDGAAITAATASGLSAANSASAAATSATSAATSASAASSSQSASATSATNAAASAATASAAAAALASINPANIAITGGSINGTPIGATTESTGRFTTLTTTGAATIQSLSTASAAITGGSINSTPVGNTTPSTGSFTSMTVSGTFTLGSTAITSTSAEINKLTGATVTTAEINYLSGVTSGIQAQINAVEKATRGPKPYFMGQN